MADEQQGHGEGGHDSHGEGGHDSHGGGYDTELDVRSIVGFALGVAGFTALALVAMWWMSTTFKEEEQAKDRPPSPLLEARGEPIPPGPRLQSAPPRDMDELRARDREALTTYGWVDQSAGVAHIPVARAIAILAAKSPSNKEQK